MRSVPSFPIGTRSQVPRDSKSTMQFEFEVQEFADAHPGRSEQSDADSGEEIIEPGDSGHDVAVDGWGQGSGHGFGHAWDVAD